jgi:hypothetical protein
MRRHPVTNEKLRFPGLKKCLAMMRNGHDPQMAEDGFHWLRPRAAEYVDELIQELPDESDHGMRCWLLELVGEARAESALPTLLEQARGNDESLRNWAMRGLKNLNSKAARTAIWELFGEKVPSDS